MAVGYDSNEDDDRDDEEDKDDENTAQPDGH